MGYELGFFGDERLDRTGDHFMELVSNWQGGRFSLHAIGEDRNDEIRLTRFLHNERVNIKNIVETMQYRTSLRVKDRHVLAIQDSTYVHSTQKASSAVRVHPTLAVDAETGAIYGLCHAQAVYYEAKKDRNIKKLPVDKKASLRWLEGTEQASQLKENGGARTVTVVCDREADIFAEFALCPQNTHYVIRSAHNRYMIVNGGRMLIKDFIEQLPEQQRVVIEVQAIKGREAREAKCVVKYSKITLNRPIAKKQALLFYGKKLPDCVTLYVVDIKEYDAPKGVSPLHWRLFTNHIIENNEQAHNVIKWYRMRWTIEELFRTMKARGFDVESMRQAVNGPLEKLILIIMLAAIKVMALVRVRDGNDDIMVIEEFTEEDIPILQAISKRLEGNTARLKNPHPPHTLAFAAWVCARLGGWTVYYSKPGPAVMLAGLKRYCAMKFGWILSNNLKNNI